jgi:hypothetical protein
MSYELRYEEEKIDLQAQKEELEKQPLIEEYVQLATQREIVYARVVRALADAFGEEEVLDLVEKAAWDLGVEAGKSWRPKFEQDPVAALHEKAHSWFDDPLFFARLCCCDLRRLEGKRWDLAAVKCYREVFRRINEPKIGLTRCITDIAAVRGWWPYLIMRQPRHMLRGDNYCYQIREIVDDPSLQWDYSKETSERVGWRSIKKLEEA